MNDLLVPGDLYGDACPTDCEHLYLVVASFTERLNIFDYDFLFAVVSNGTVDKYDLPDEDLVRIEAC